MYSAFDLMNSRYLITGRNSRSYRECLEAVRTLMAFEHEDDVESLADEHLLKSMGVRIDSHTRRVQIGADDCVSKVIMS